MKFLSILRHPNIISLKAFDGRLFAIYVEPLPLSLHRGIESPFDTEDATTILRDTSAALKYLASKGIVHNDIKPANIAYSPQRGAVVLDFGLAMSTDEKTLPGGTPWYVPPDLITEGRRGLPGDIWALGITMLYVLKKIKLPEKTEKAWVIRNVLDRRGKDQKQMIEFLDRIRDIKEKLRRDVTVERIVYEMLDWDVSNRVTAEQIQQTSI
ncbi:serine/threonine-protein kinase PLK4 [Colletotrichum liriopes]|uniref:Serine/threonine-protein kinase PLK4 n=1 Tax=Colletotrichum liriopes TaxID=708192 RepID=A0AA37H0I6_9PEZI|nr:serine/threonine-protein kinase PLK4 [Colletotrichum liriopes]